MNLRRATRLITKHYNDALAPVGLTVSQYTLLVALRLLEEAGMVELAEALGTDRTTLTRNLGPLEREGWISTQPGEDRRNRRVSLTAAGRDRLRRAVPLWERAQAEAEARLGTREAARLVRTLSDFAGA